MVPVYRARIEGDGIEPIINEERYFRIDEVEAALDASGYESLRYSVKVMMATRWSCANRPTTTSTIRSSTSVAL
jgi:hypothetical protein